MTGFRTAIKNIRLKTDATGKTTVIPAPAYASVSDKLKRQSSKKVMIKRQLQSTPSKARKSKIQSLASALKKEMVKRK